MSVDPQLFRVPPFVRLSAALAMLATFASAQPLPKESPFAGPVVSATAKAPAADFELLGMSVVGKTTLIGISRTSDRHSFWIPLGGTIAEITAVSFNAKTDEAVIRIGGQPLTLSMRRASITPATSAAPTAASVAAPGPAPSLPMPSMTAQEEKEMEARMLVSDLLEIGQQQRRAYEAAQKAAAAQPAAAQPAADKGAARKTKP